MSNPVPKVTAEVLQAFADAWNRHDVDALMSFMSDDCVFEASAGPDVCGSRYAGREAVRAAFAEVWTTFPDAHWGNALHFVNGNRGVSEWIFTGTRADGTRVEVNGCDLFTFRGGKITLKNSYRKNRPERASTADREFIHSRLIDAPRERVFRAFAEPEHLAKWWGPNGFTSTIHTFELRPGGHWRFVMHGPDGTNYPNENAFREVVAGQRVVLEHLSQTHHFFLTITFSDQDGGTLVGWRQVFDSAAHKEQVAAVVLEANEQNLDRLANEVLSVR